MKAVKWWLELIKGIFEAYEKTTTNHNGYSPLLFKRSFLIAFVKQTINSQITLIVVGFTAYSAVLAGINLETSPKILPPIPEYEITTKPSTILSTIYTRLPLRVKNALILFISS